MQRPVVHEGLQHAGWQIIKYVSCQQVSGCDRLHSTQSPFILFLILHSRAVQQRFQLFITLPLAGQRWRLRQPQPSRMRHAGSSKGWRHHRPYSRAWCKARHGPEWQATHNRWSAHEARRREHPWPLHRQSLLQRDGPAGYAQWNS